MEPDAATSETRGNWTYRPPWPDLPRDIVFSGLSFTPDQLLASQEASRIELPEMLRSASSKRLADYVAGRLCAHSAIQRLSGQILQVGRQSDGAPSWPLGFCGSISHTAGQAIAVAARVKNHRSVGVDVERVLSPDQAEALASLILTPSEQARFNTYPLELATTAVFSLKEALFKLLYPLTDVMFFHEQAEVLSLEDNGRANLRLLDTLSAQWPAGTILSALWHRSHEQVFSILEC